MPPFLFVTSASENLKFKLYLIRTKVGALPLPAVALNFPSLVLFPPASVGHR
jgi:hypothetical protein